MMLEDLYRLLRSGHVQAQGVVDTMTQPIVVLDQNLSVTTANNAFVKTFNVQRDDILEQNFFSLGDGQWDIAELRHLIAAVIPKAAAVIGFEVTHDFPGLGARTFLVDARRLIHPDDNSSNILVLFHDVTERQRETAEMEFIVSETRHRMKNLFSVVRAIAMQTDVDDVTALEYRQALLGRLEATFRAQELAATDETADFETLVKQSASELGLDRIRCSGPSVQLSASRVLPASMIFHELTTNAIKYGALSVPEGSIEISWGVEPGPKGRDYVVCLWREIDGPTVQEPSRQGYGTSLIKATSAQAGGAVELNYDRSGLAASIRIAVR
ncbi:PAS domain-containing protein (plasmid) [Rhizobium acidisoli]|uniref:Blue-light-activated histidine kinase n=1 Tax=Rhizobium acidisoli TaxID=1538158 RepID=A0AAE5WV79_9HYPH|nr:HWE histidine kinase domain-containing protein [Rhizobium acidisoli]KPH05089.1 histidine kinase [Rhizobium acidisoli]QAS83177.1 PAS domain-containing protein [Rhizobium acidisoli]